MLINKVKIKVRHATSLGLPFEIQFIIVKLHRFKQHVHDQRSIALSLLSVSTTTTSMGELMMTGTHSVKVILQSRSQCRNAPRLADGMASLLAVFGNQVILATVKVGTEKAKLLENRSNTRIPPVKAMPRQLHEDTSTDLLDVFENYHE